MRQESEAGEEEAPGRPRPAAPLTSLIGREETLAELAGLQPRTRLLTLTGPGGCGKSRLARELADSRSDDYPGGVWWVELSVTEPDLVGPRVAGTVVEDAPAAGPPLETVVRRLRGPAALLVLDNCEHVVDVCASLVGALLERCPELQILATGRIPLGVPGEQLWRLEGLALAGAGEDPEASPAVALFAERARLAAPAFAVTPDTAEAVSRVCGLVDGMPLAIELAAAKMSLLSVEEIAERLEHDLRVLRSGSRAVPARHRSLEATLDWSSRLLTAPERALLRRLSVFPGSFSLGAVEAVCAGEPVAAAEVLDLLAALVEQSLVQVGDAGAGSRYSLLQTVRRYAAGELATAGETRAVEDRHAAFFLRLAETAGAGPADAADELEAERDNLRAALQSRLPGAPEQAGRLVGALWPCFTRWGAYDEGRRSLEQALALAGAMSPAVRAEVLRGAGVLAFLQCDYELAVDRLEVARSLADELGDRRGLAIGLQRLGSVAREQGRYAAARDLHERSRAVWAELGDELGVATSDDYLAFAAWLSGDLGAAEDLGRRALAVFRGASRRDATAAALINLGAVAQYRGDQTLASERLARALAISRDLGYREGVAWSLNELAIVSRRRHHPARAADLLREALLVHRDLGDRWRMASVLEEIAGSLLARVDPRAAAGVLGAAHALREAIGAPIPPVEEPDREWALEATRRRLGGPAFAAAWDQGRALSLEAAVDAALEATTRLYGAGDVARSGVHPPLTEREQAVVALLAQGRTNREIGVTLYISPSTAGVHVSNILRKLGATSRAEATALALRLGLVPGGSEPPAAEAGGGG